MIDVERVYPPKTLVRVLPHAWTVEDEFREGFAGAIGMYYGVDSDGHVRVKFDDDGLPGYVYYGPDELEVYDPYAGDDNE